MFTVQFVLQRRPREKPINCSQTLCGACAFSVLLQHRQEVKSRLAWLLARALAYTVKGGGEGIALGTLGQDSKGVKRFSEWGQRTVWKHVSRRGRGARGKVRAESARPAPSKPTASPSGNEPRLCCGSTSELSNFQRYRWKAAADAQEVRILLQGTHVRYLPRSRHWATDVLPG